MMPHACDAAIALQAQPDGRYLGHTSPAYGNMVGPFGGITAAQALNAVLQHPQLQATGAGCLLGQVQAQAFRNGYFDQTAQLWNEAGELLVTTHQVVYYKE